MRTVTLILLLLFGLAGCDQSAPAAQRDRALNRALRALERGDTDEALSQIDAAIALDRGASHLHQVRGSILFHTQQYGEAVAAYDEAYRLNDRSAEAALGAGLTLAMQNKDAEARIRYERAEELYSYRAENPPDAESFSQDAIDTAVIDARLHLALIAALRGEEVAAIGQIDRLASGYPDWDDADRWRAIIEKGGIEALLHGEL